jgi:hypothetical protein
MKRQMGGSGPGGAYLLYACGLRISEAIGLTSHNPNPFLDHRQGRKAAAPVLPLVRKCWIHTLFWSPLKPSEPMFRSRGGPSCAHIQLLIERMRGVLNPPDTATPHALRHSLPPFAGQWGGPPSSRSHGPCQPSPPRSTGGPAHLLEHTQGHAELRLFPALLL